MDAEKELSRLFKEHGQQIIMRPWVHEIDRWIELIFCLLLYSTTASAQSLRQAVAQLRTLSLIDPHKLAHIDDSSNNEDRIIVDYVLRQHGCSAEQSATACIIIAKIAALICQKYQGKPQRLLRVYAERMRDALVAELDAAVADSHSMKGAISLWLQNALSLPISIEHPALSAFCQAHKVDVNELLRITDDLDINIALLDDILQIAYATAGQSDSEQKT